MELITTHIGADFDAFASMVAANKLYPQAVCSFPGSVELNVRNFLALHKHFFPIKKIKDIQFEKVTKLIIVDTRLASRIGDFSKLLSNSKLKVHIYDHHPFTDEDITGEVNVNEMLGATSSILTNIIKKKNIALLPTEATILALGIYEDTGSLTYGSTTPFDLDAAAFLLRSKANLNILSDFVSPGLNAEQLNLLNILISDMRTIKINGVKVAIATAVPPRPFGSLSLVIHKLRDMENLSLVFGIVKIGDIIQVIARSKVAGVDVGNILEALGGGGHTRAASAKIRSDDIKDIEKKLLSILEIKIKPLVAARDIMITPVRTIQEDMLIEEARKIMLSFNFSALPVIKNKKLVGIISRSDIDKVIQHQLKDSYVKSYMSIKPITISPETGIEEIQRVMIEHNIGHLPVIGPRNRLQGMVTREELLKVLHNNSVSETGYSLYSTPLVKKNVKSLLAKRVSPFLQKLLKKIGSTAGQLGYPVFVVGGFVRDVFLDIENLDIDVVVEKDGIKFGQTLAKKLKGEFTSHQKFATSVVQVKKFPASWKIELESPLRIDVATARTEFYEYPAALPEVELSSIKQDLYRRDFTINAMAIRLDGKYYGELYDFFGGEKDLREKNVKVLHNLSFVDDPTRIFRAIKLSSRYDLKIEIKTLSFIKSAIDLGLFDVLAGERIREEIIAMLDEPEPVKAIKQMVKLEMLFCIHPSLKFTSSIENEFNCIQDFFSWVILYAKNGIKRWLTYFMSLTGNLDEKEIEETAQKFKFTTEEKNIIFLVKNKNRITAALNKKNISNSKIYAVLNTLPMEFILFLMARGRKTYVKKNIALFITKLSKIKLMIDGEKLKTLGFKPGPQYKKIFSRVLSAKLDGEITKGIKKEIKYIKKNFKAQEE